MNPKTPGKGNRLFSRRISLKRPLIRRGPPGSLWRRIFKGSELSDKDIYVMNMAIAFFLLVVIVFLSDLAARTLYEDPNSLRPMQKFEAEIIVAVQRDIFGVEVDVYNGTSLDYVSGQTYHGYNLTKKEKEGDVVLEISSTCSGLHEMVFLSVLIGGFPGVALRKRLIWAPIMAGIMFVENLFRIWILFFIIWMISREYEGKFHYQFWQIGQYFVMMGLFMVWFYFVASDDIDSNMDKKAPAKKEKENGDLAGDVAVKTKDEAGTDVEKNEDVTSGDPVKMKDEAGTVPERTENNTDKRAIHDEKSS